MAGNNWKFNPTTGTMEPVAPSLDIHQKKGAPTVPVISGGHSLMQDVPVNKPVVSVNEREIKFREKSDLTVVQITDYDTNRVMGYIAGYGLDINFNMDELNSVDKVEQFLDGLKKAFRCIILEKALGSK